MSKKKYLIGSIILIIFSCLIVFLFLYFKNKENNNEDIILNADEDFIYLGTNSEMIADENYLFKDYSDFKDKFNSDKISEADFEKYNFVLISTEYDLCSEYDFTPTDYSIDGNNIIVTIKYRRKCGVCPREYLYYVLKIDKKLDNPNVKVDYQAVNKTDCDPNVSYKPIIYLYPTTDTEVEIKLLNDKYLTTTYPKYNNSWTVMASNDGKLIDLKTGREQYGLYWEGINNNVKIENDGFIVEGKDTLEFLEDKLRILGLSDREADEFIIYWLPKMENNKYNYIRFETIDEINEYMPLSISPTPDSIIRVWMTYKPLTEKIDVIEQKLESTERYGFSVVEWGGTIIE